MNIWEAMAAAQKEDGVRDYDLSGMVTLTKKREFNDGNKEESLEKKLQEGADI